jgi:hypothetical protein
MAVTTYAELQDSIAAWLARVADTKITANADDFITLAEAYINRHLRVRQMETAATITTTNGSTNLDDDYLAWKRLTWLGDPYRSLEYVSPDMLNRMYPDTEDGYPSVFTIEGSDIIIRPVDDSTSLSFLYYTKVPALSDDNTTNWLLTAHPDLYLAASLAEANAFLINPDHAALWAQKRDMVLDQITKLSEKTKGPTSIKPIGTWY